MSLPTYDEQSIAKAAPKVLLPGDGNSVMVGNDKYTFKVTGDDTYGRFGLFEVRMNGRSGIKPHTHKEMIEMFYVVEGEMTFLVGDTQKTLTTGSIATIPRSMKHAFANSGDHLAIMHIMFCPAAKREHYFEGLAEMAKQAGSIDPEALRRFWSENDQFPAEDSSWPY